MATLTKLKLFVQRSVGSYLRTSGFNARYDWLINGHTPDWSILDSQLRVKGIIELFTFNRPNGTEKSNESFIESLKREGETWIGSFPKDENRLDSKIRDKAGKSDYINLVKDHHIPYVVSIIGHPLAALETDEIEEVLPGLFKEYPTMSGFLFFYQSRAGVYEFKYTPNPEPSFSVNIPSGSFSL